MDRILQGVFAVGKDEIRRNMILKGDGCEGAERMGGALRWGM